MKEIWKDISGYEGLYQISNLGNVKSLNFGRLGRSQNLKIGKHHTGYQIVVLAKDKQRKTKLVHVLVASAFIPNPEHKPCVNHIDGDKTHNEVLNLEWVTRSENTRHAIKTGLRADSNMWGRTGKLNPLSRPVNQLSKDGVFVKSWPCISDAARSLSCNPCTIVNCLQGRIKSCKGYIWEYAEG